MQKKQLITLTSDNFPDIYLQEITLKDATQIYVDWLNDKEVNQYLETRFTPQTLGSVINFIRDIYDNPNEHLFTIRLSKNNAHIGNIKIGSINQYHKTADISLFIGDKNSWGKGYATQAIHIVSQYGFNNLALRKLCAGAYKPNIGSTKAFLKAGYQLDGVLTDHYLLNKQTCDRVQVCLFNK